MRSSRVVVSALVSTFLLIACGSRTGLLSDDGIVYVAPADAIASDVGDTTLDVTDAPQDEDVPDVVPIREGGLLDVALDCDAPSTCNPADPDHLYRCGVPYFECSSLEQCKDGQCKNPCKDTLGQDTSNGCEFYSVEADLTDEAKGVCFAVFVVNQWKTGEPARIQVDRGGGTLPIESFARIPVGTGVGLTYAPYVASAGLARDQIAILFLSRDPAAASDPTVSAPRRLAGCPPGVTPAFVGDAAVHGTARGTAFHLTTNVPVVAYQMLPYGGGRARVTGATLLLPTNVWDVNYLAVNAYKAPTLFSEKRAGPTLAIVAQASGTHVSIKPTADIVPGPGVVGGAAGTVVNYTLGRGEYVQFTQPSELTGSAIEADQPIAVLGGSTLMDVPTDRVRADGAEQMLPPVGALGSEYVGVRYRSRDPSGEEAPPWRIVGAVDGTTLRYDPPQPGAPTQVGAQQLVEWNAPGPFVVRSQDRNHPFYLAQYMTGGEPYDGAGDPEFVNVVPPAQYLPRYTFFTDPTYPETNLVFVRQKDVTGAFPPVTLDCIGTLTGWSPVDIAGKYQFVRVDLSRGDFQPQGQCDNGVHAAAVGTAAAGGNFGITVWGWGSGATYKPDVNDTDEANPKFTRWVSYGYPAGANITRLNGVRVPAR